MAETMVERVARALHRIAMARRAANRIQTDDIVPWQRHLPDARAAIAAMFSAADKNDWDRLIAALGDGGHDHFWKHLIGEIRGSIEQ